MENRTDLVPSVTADRPSHINLLFPSTEEALKAEFNSYGGQVDTVSKKPNSRRSHWDSTQGSGGHAEAPRRYPSQSRLSEDDERITSRVS